MNTSGGKDKTSNPSAGRSVSTNARAVFVRNNKIDSAELFVSSKEITIAHGDELYRLRLTAQNKLILTK